MKYNKTIRKKTAVILLGVAFVLLFATACKKNNMTIKIGTGNEGGSYYMYAGKLAECAKDSLDIKVTTTAGSIANVRLLQKGFLDASIVQNDILYNAANQKKAPDNQQTSSLNYSAVAGLYTESVQIVVKEDSGIDSVDDLYGKKVCVGEKESGTIHNAEDILGLYGISFGDIEEFNLSLSDSKEALKNDEIDAFFFTAGAPTQSVSELSGEVSLRILSFTGEEMGKIQKKYPYYIDVTIPAGTYEGITEDIRTVGVRAVLVVSNRMSENTVKLLAENVLIYSEKLNENIATDSAYGVQESTEYIPIPFHPGAVDYYSSHGIDVDAINGSTVPIIFGGQDE